MVIRSQDYAQRAYGLVVTLQNDPQEAKYRTLALGMPAMILQAGLSQSVGFLLAKGGTEHIVYLKHLSQLLFENDDYESMHRFILGTNIQQYQSYTRKTLEASSHLKRYTQALLDK